MIDAEQCNSVLGQQSDLIGEHCIKRYRSHFLPMHGQLVAARSGSEKRTKGKRVFMTFDSKHHRSTLLDWYTRKDLGELNEQLAAGDISLFKRIEKKIVENPRRLRTAADIERVFASYDYTNDGLITVSEFRDGLKVLGLNIPDHDFGRLVAHVDAGRSGLIDYAAFVKAATSGLLHTARQDLIIDDNWVTTHDAVTTYDALGGAHHDGGVRRADEYAHLKREQGKDLWQPEIQRGQKPRARTTRPMLLANAKRLNAIDWHEPSRPGTGSRPQPHRTLDMKREVLRDREQTALRAGRAYDEWGRLIIARPDNPGGTERGPPPLHEQVAMAQKREDDRMRRRCAWQQ